MSFLISALNACFYREDVEYPSIISLVDRVIEIQNTTKEDLLIDALLHIQSLKQIDAIICLLECTVLPVARAAAKLNIPFTGSKAIERSRNKGLCRARLHECGVPSPKFVVARDMASVLEAADKISFPLVLKPALGTASMFAKVVHNRLELSQAFQDYQDGMSKLSLERRQIFQGDALIEEYLKGDMISLEIGGAKGEYYPFGILQRKRYRYDETIEVGSIAPAQISKTEWENICKYGIDILRALELDTGIFHLEMILTDEGPRLIEANPRLIGGAGPLLLNHTWEFDVYEQLINIHLGQPVKVPLEIPTYCNVSHVFGSESDVTVANGDMSWLSEYKNSLREFNLRIKPGDSVKKFINGFDYFGYLIVTAESFEVSMGLCNEILDRMSQALALPFIR